MMHRNDNLFVFQFFTQDKYFHPKRLFLSYLISKTIQKIISKNSFNGGGILLYIREDITSKLILTKITIEEFFVEINLRKKRWLLCCSHNPKKLLISEHLNEIGKTLDLLLSKYDNFMLIGDLNAEPTEAAVSDFCEIYNLKHLVKDKACFKNPTKPTCIDLIVTDRPKCFQDTVVFETGLSDFII